MKHLLLERKPSGVAETQGFLTFNNRTIMTIEQEWREDPARPGGESNNSCVPAGKYELIPHIRPNGDVVVALINEALGVFYLPDDMSEEGGRFLILMHIGNWSTDIVGCIAPGLSRADSDKGPMVTSSKAAMKLVMDYIDGENAELEIRWIT